MYKNKSQKSKNTRDKFTEHKNITTCTKIQLKVIGVIKNLVAYRKIRCSQMSVVRYRFFLAYDKELCRSESDTSSAFGTGTGTGNRA